MRVKTFPETDMNITHSPLAASLWESRAADRTVNKPCVTSGRCVQGCVIELSSMVVACKDG